MVRHPLLGRALLFYSLHLPGHKGKWWVVDRVRKRLRIEIDEDRIVERGGIKWILNPADYVQTNLFWLGCMDRLELRQLWKYFLRPGIVFFDIGSNFGYYSLTVAAGLRGDCRIHAFEPNPDTFRRLSKNIEFNGFQCITARQLGLSDSAGRAGLIVPAHNTGGTTLTEGDKIPVTTVDAYCREQGLQQVDFIKMDVEGAEVEALQGARTTLQRFRPRLSVATENLPDDVERVPAAVRAIVPEYQFRPGLCRKIRKFMIRPEVVHGWVQ